MVRLVLEPRAAPQRFMRLGAPLLALALTVLVSIPLLRGLGLPPAATLRIFFIEPVSTANGISEWLLKAAPLILIALGLATAFRANVWNIGAEGMYTVGAIAAAALGLRFGGSAHAWLLPAMAVVGAFAGMAWAAIPALLKTLADANEILVTLMLNYLAALLLMFLVNGPMQDPQGLNYPQSAALEAAAMYTPLFPGMRLTASILVIPAAVCSFWLLLERSFLGFQMTVSGSAPAAARYAGFSRARVIWLSLAVSGATAGLAGALELSGPLGQLSPVISPGYGFTAIIVAFVGRLNPLGVVFGGLLLALFYLGGEAVQMTLNVPASLARSFQGLLLFFLLAADVLIHRRLRISRRSWATG